MITQKPHSLDVRTAFPSAPIHPPVHPPQTPARQPQFPAAQHAPVSWPQYDSAAAIARSVDPDHVPPLRVLVVDDDAPVRNASSEIA